MKIVKGHRIGIIGPTGSGKTSLINLLPKFYKIDSGTIRINDIDIKDINEKSIREKIAIVPQKNTLFAGSIIENIRWGNENATDEEIYNAAKLANIHDFIMTMPNGYDTVVGERGVFYEYFSNNTNLNLLYFGSRYVLEAFDYL